MEKIMGAFLYIKRKWREPSTQASLCALSAYLGVHVDVVIIQDFLNLATIGFGVLGFFYNEAKPATKVE